MYVTHGLTFGPLRVLNQRCVHTCHFTPLFHTHAHRPACVSLQPDVNDAVVEALRAVKAAL